MNYTLLMMLSGKKVLLVSLVVSVDFFPWVYSRYSSSHVMVKVTVKR